MKAISSLVNVDSIDNDKNLEGGFSAESRIESVPRKPKRDQGSLMKSARSLEPREQSDARQDNHVKLWRTSSRIKRLDPNGLPRETVEKAP